MDWIECSKSNPPPINTPMLVWTTEKPFYLGGPLRLESIPLWVDECWTNVGDPEDDFTHWMIVDRPRKEKEEC